MTPSLSTVYESLDTLQKQAGEFQSALFQAQLKLKAIEEGRDEVLVGPSEVARVLSCSRQSVYERARDGSIPCYRNGGSLLFSIREVKDALRSKA